MFSKKPTSAARADLLVSVTEGALATACVMVAATNIPKDQQGVVIAACIQAQIALLIDAGQA